MNIQMQGNLQGDKILKTAYLLSMIYSLICIESPEEFSLKDSDVIGFNKHLSNIFSNITI